MNFFEELRVFGKGMSVWLIFWLIFSAFFFFFGLQKVEIFNKELLVPWLNNNSFAVLFFETMKKQVLPPGVQLVVLSPLAAFLGQMTIAFFLGFFVSLPIGFYKILSFVLPAFKSTEKKSILAIFFPSIILFFAGCLFAYVFIMPTTFEILYAFANTMGVVAYFDLNSFIFLFLGMGIITGLMFLLPVFMAMLVGLKIVNADFWGKKWQYASVFFLAVSAIVTPDGTGITMILLVIPLTLLYLAGYTVSKIIQKGRKV